jgi:hypothetical protein
MSERKERFEVGDDCRLEVRLGSGGVRIVGGEAGVVEITLSGSSAMLDRITVEQRGSAVVVEVQGKNRRWSRVDLVAVVPDGIDADLKLGSGDLTIDPPLDSLRVGMAAGDVRARDVHGDADLKTASGDVTLGTVGGRLSAAGASGDLRVDRVDGDLDVNIASGDLRVGYLTGHGSVRTASGDVVVDRLDGPGITVKTLAGDVTLGIPPGRTLDVDLQSLSGRVVNRLEPDPDAPRTGHARIASKTVSGDVLLVPARD